MRSGQQRLTRRAVCVESLALPRREYVANGFLRAGRPWPVPARSLNASRAPIVHVDLFGKELLGLHTADVRARPVRAPRRDALLGWRELQDADRRKGTAKPDAVHE